MARTRSTVDLDIGRPTIKQVQGYVDVENFNNVITAVEAATTELQEAVLRLKQIALGTGLAIGVDLNEEVE